MRLVLLLLLLFLLHPALGLEQNGVPFGIADLVGIMDQLTMKVPGCDFLQLANCFVPNMEDDMAEMWEAIGIVSTMQFRSPTAEQFVKLCRALILQNGTVSPHLCPQLRQQMSISEPASNYANKCLSANLLQYTKPLDEILTFAQKCDEPQFGIKLEKDYSCILRLGQIDPEYQLYVAKQAELTVEVQKEVENLNTIMAQGTIPNMDMISNLFKKVRPAICCSAVTGVTAVRIIAAECGADAAIAGNYTNYAVQEWFQCDTLESACDRVKETQTQRTLIQKEKIASGKISCESDRYQTCLQPFNELGSRGIGEIPIILLYRERSPTATEFEKICRSARASLTCLRDFADECLPTDPDFMGIKVGLHELVTSTAFCTKPSFGKVTEESYSCLLRLHKKNADYRECVSQGADIGMELFTEIKEPLVKILFSSDHDEGIDSIPDVKTTIAGWQSKIPEICCKQEAYNECASGLIKKHCGAATSFFSGVINEAVNQMLDCSSHQSYCKEYRVHTDHQEL